MWLKMFQLSYSNFTILTCQEPMTMLSYCYVATDVSLEFSSNFRTLPDDVTAHARQDSRQRHLEVAGVVVLTEE